jgi:molybdenum cofactor cytidylyltransferase
MPTIGLILLAAGGSTRLGTPKQLLQYDGKTLLRRAAETALTSTCRPIQVVLGASAEQCVLELRDLPLSTVVNEAWVEGMGSSLRLGLETLLSASPAPPDAVIVMLCDQPLLTVGILDALAEAYATISSPIIASQYGEVSGVPALFDRSLFPELLHLSGAQGAKQIIGRHADQMHQVPFPDGAVDIDTAADYARLRPA